MASKGNWTVVFEDKLILKNYAEGASEGIGYVIDDDTFWNDSKFSNIWAIQYGTTVSTDEVEYRDTTPHSTFADANIGDISQFSNKWDAAHLAQLQSDWDTDNVDGEAESEKITRLGARPTSYSS
jgi:hypothetical protein|tara:strand:+ start:561 stop:935 length:375 start_codon:yes stop_codon:yes gene_type:complete